MRSCGAVGHGFDFKLRGPPARRRFNTACQHRGRIDSAQELPRIVSIEGGEWAGTGRSAAWGSPSLAGGGGRNQVRGYRGTHHWGANVGAPHRVEEAVDPTLGRAAQRAGHPLTPHRDPGADGQLSARSDRAPPRAEALRGLRNVLKRARLCHASSSAEPESKRSPVTQPRAGAVSERGQHVR